MTEEGMLSILRRGTTYQVRYASSNPHDMDRQPYQCSDEVALVALLHQCGLESWSIERAIAELRHGRVAVLPIVLSEAQRQTYFPLPQVPCASARAAAAAPSQAQGSAYAKGHANNPTLACHERLQVRGSLTPSAGNLTKKHRVVSNGRD